MLETLRLDVRCGARVFRRAPTLAAAVVLTLSLGVGVSSVLLTLFNGLFLRPNVGHDPDSFATAFVSVEGGAARTVRGEPTSATRAEFDAIRAHTTTLAAVTASAWATFEVSGRTAARLRGKWVSCNHLSAHVPGVVAGRTLQASDCVTTDATVAVLSATTWANEFAADPEVVGRSVTVNGHPVAIVGVVPDTPVRDAVAPQMFVPYTSKGLLEPADDPFHRAPGQQAWLSISGRLAPGATRAGASAEMQRIVDAVNRPLGRISSVVVTDGAPVHDPAAARHLPAVVGLGAMAIGLVLLLAAANVAMLLLARVVAREGELAMRYRLGATPARLVQQLLVEGAVVAVPAVAVGSALALVLPDWVAQRASGFPLAVSLVPDTRVLSAVAALTVAAGLSSSVLPALHARRLAASSGGMTVTPRSHAWLLVPQIAVTMTLLVTVALLTGAQRRHLQPQVPYDVHAMVVATVRQSSAASPWQERDRQTQMLREAQAVAGVRHVALSSPAPFAGDASALVTSAEGAAPVVTSVRSVSASYFALAGVELRRGRWWDDARADSAGSLEVVVSEALHARLRLRRDLPQRVELEGGREAFIVGIAADTSSILADRRDGPLLYVPVSAVRVPEVAVLTRGDAASHAAVYAAVQRAAAGQSVTVESLATTLARAGLSYALAAELMSAVAGLGLVLACVGTFGAVAFAVGRRRAEIAVRQALGAPRVRLVVQCLTNVGRPFAVGAAAGVGLSVVVAVTLSRTTSIGAGITPWSLGPPVAIVAAASAAAALVPVLRAVRSPVWTALRSE